MSQTITTNDLALARKMASAIGEELTLDGWIAIETQQYAGDDADAIADQCRAIWDV